MFCNATALIEVLHYFLPLFVNSYPSFTHLIFFLWHGILSAHYSSGYQTRKPPHRSQRRNKGKSRGLLLHLYIPFLRLGIIYHCDDSSSLPCHSCFYFISARLQILVGVSMLQAVAGIRSVEHWITCPLK